MSEDPHTVLHVYEGDGGIIIRDGGNISTFGVQSRAIKAAFDAATGEPAREHRAIYDLSGRLAEAEREVARCHTRLEIDHAFQLVDGWLERFDIPAEDRASWPDAVSCRDETIAILEQRAEAADASLARMREALLAYVEADGVTGDAGVSLAEYDKKMEKALEKAVAALRNSGRPLPSPPKEG